MENLNFVRPRPNFPKRAVITGGMPYGNKELHFAHFGGYMVHADTLARFLRDRIGKENVVFVSGTDCYGSPIMETYRKLDDEKKKLYPSIEDFVRHNHEVQKQTYLNYEIEHNLFGASGLEPAKSVHAGMSKYFIENLYNKNSISLLSSMQFYDEEHKCLLNGRQVVGKCPIEGCQSEKGYADECDLGHQYRPIELIDPISSLSGKTPKLVEIKNWYFNLQDCVEPLKNWTASLTNNKATRSFMVKEMNEFFKLPELYIKRDQLPKFNEIKHLLPEYEDTTANEKMPSITIVFKKLTDREKACDILAENHIRFRSGKTLVPFRLTGDVDWGVNCPEIEGVKNQTFYVWPESLWAPISFTKTYLQSIGKPEDEWKKFWCSKDSEIYQFIGEDNLYFYGPAQQAIWLRMNGKDEVSYEEGDLKPTNIIPSKHVLFLNKKASSSGSFRPPMAKDLLEHYTAEQMRMHFLGMNLGNNNVSFMPKPFNPDAKTDEVDVVLKEGNLLTNVYNRVLRTLFYTVQKEFDGVIPASEIDENLKSEMKNTILNYEKFMYEHKFHQVINCVDVFVRNINKYWVKEIKNCEDKNSLAKLIANTLQMIFVANVLLHPIAPSGTENVANYLGLKENWSSWDYIFDDVYSVLKNKENHTIKFLKEKEDFFKKHPSQLEDFEN